MPILSPSSGHQWILSLKIILLSTGVLSTALLLKLSVPVLTDFLLSEIPTFWNCFLSWLTPPYLYLLINCIIISILASSRLHHGPDDDESPVAIPETADLNSYSYSANQSVATKISDLRIDESSGVYGRIDVEPQPRVSEMEMKGENDGLIVLKASDEAAVSSPMQRKDSVGLLLSSETEKPPVSSRIGQRKSVKASPEGKPLGVSKPKRHDTLESTWKTITDGRSMPLTRHLRKSDTWEQHGRRAAATAAVAVGPATPPSKLMRKSETFNDRSAGKASPSLSPGGSGRLRREASLTQDELNRRVEAFIKKFNDEMRLQRQESLKQYQEMMGRGAH